jgi:ketosteroid isomerase-like protein
MIKECKMEKQIEDNGRSYNSKQGIDEAEIKQKINNHIEALRNKDLENVMSIYASDLVSFDVEGNYVGSEAKKKAWVNVFSVIEPPLNYEIRDLVITVTGDAAFSHSRRRLSGKLKNGKQIGSWVRYTACFRKIRGNWIIIHEHVSLPVDFKTGNAILDLSA